jgi:spermidine synthase
LGATAVLLAASLFKVTSYEDGYDCETGRFHKSAVVRRDHVATIVSCGEGMEKRLMCNGIALTHLTTITKMMGHVPLALLKEKPKSALVICLGMGTTFRSLASWDVDTTAVELVPGVRDAFGYYHQDADAVLRKPDARIIVDDGRRFLNRTDRRFDVITIDPPPPIEAAGSSLLYSEEFCSVVKSRLTEGGIFMQWCPGGEMRTMVAMVRAVCSVFPHVRIFCSIEGWGLHVFASMQPIEMPKIQEFIRRLPQAAAADLVEWAQGQPPARLYVELLRREMDLPNFRAKNPNRTIRDDSPYNEYFLLRRLAD